MEMFSKLTSLFQALETREPSVDLQESFVEHWKGITNYYIQTTDEERPARQTDIPWRLKQMLDILVYEEGQQAVEETGPCLEYLLQHKLLETLCTLGKAQYPPGMLPQVLIFASSLLVQIKKPLLQMLNIYRPIQKLIGLCALPGSQTEKEGAQFLLAVCTQVKQDPYLLNYVLKIPILSKSKMADSTSNQSQDTNPSDAEIYRQSCDPTSPSPSLSLSGSTSSIHSQQENTADSLDQSESGNPQPQAVAPDLLSALVHLTQSQSARVRLKAHEGLLLLASLRAEGAGETLAQRTQLAALLSGRLVELYSLIPSEELNPHEILNLPPVAWSQFSQADPNASPLGPGLHQVTLFFCWLNFLDHMMTEAPQVLSERLSGCVHRLWLSGVVLPQLMSMGESAVLLGTVVLCRVVQAVRSTALLDRLVLFLLGSHAHPEQPVAPGGPHNLRWRLIQHCDHISEEISLASLRLFEELLRKPHRDILSNLVLRNLGPRHYLSPALVAPDDRHSDSEGDSEDLEEDPWFPDSLYSDGQTLPSSPSSSPSRSRLSSPGSGLRGHAHSTDVINSFLCLVPQEVKSSQLVLEGGYDSYVLDARSMWEECVSLTQQDWPNHLPPPASAPVDGGAVFYEGHFLQVLFDRLGRLLEQPYGLNLQLTSVVSRLASFRHPVLSEFLLDPYIPLSPGTRTLFTVLIRVIGELMQRVQVVPDVSDRLIRMRRKLLDLDQHSHEEHKTLLRGIILLEEFCKELAAIAFVKLTLDTD